MARPIMARRGSIAVLLILALVTVFCGITFAECAFARAADHLNNPCCPGHGKPADNNCNEHCLFATSAVRVPPAEMSQVDAAPPEDTTSLATPLAAITLRSVVPVLAWGSGQLFKRIHVFLI